MGCAQCSGSADIVTLSCKGNTEAQRGSAPHRGVASDSGSAASDLHAGKGNFSKACELAADSGQSQGTSSEDEYLLNQITCTLPDASDPTFFVMTTTDDAQEDLCLGVATAESKEMLVYWLNRIIGLGSDDEQALMRVVLGGNGS